MAGCPRQKYTSVCSQILKSCLKVIRPVCNPQFGYTRLAVAGSVCVILTIATWLTIRWQPERVVKRQQAAFVEALEKRSGRKLKRVLAEDYHDRWQFSRDDAALSLLDAGSQFILLTAAPVDPIYEFPDGRTVVTMGFQLSGGGSPVAHDVIRRANRLKAPFVFTWEKQSFWPSSWRLTRIENPGLPEDLFGYEPGNISSAISRAGF
jgi:hypothetical protein